MSPSAASAEATYIPIIQSRRYGEYLPELPLEATTREVVIAEIASGQQTRSNARGKCWES